MKKLNLKKVRFATQIIMLVSVVIAAFNHYLSSIGKSISWISESIFHYICPICGVTSIYQFITSSSLFVVKVKSILGLVIGAVIILSVLFGPIIRIEDLIILGKWLRARITRKKGSQIVML